MSVVVEEDITSRSFEVTARGATLTAKYVCFGSQDEVVVYNAVRAASPIYTTTRLVRTKIGRAEFRGGRLAYVAVEYGTGEGNPNADIPAGETPDDSTPPTTPSLDANMAPNQSFSTTGGTRHTLLSLETLDKKRNSDFAGVTPDNQRAIGLRPDGVDGCDIITGKMDYTFTLQRNSVSLKDMRYWMAATGKTNDALWKGFKRGEMLFMGCEGQGSAFGGWTVNFHFAYSEDWPATDPRCIIVPGKLTISSKRGWDYLWIAFEDKLATDTLYPQPKDSYVERVYEETNFGALGIGS